MNFTILFARTGAHITPMDVMWFKKQAKRAGVTAADIADRMGRHHSVVSRIYTGRQRMSLDQAKAFAEALDVPLDQVLEHAGELDGDQAQQLQPGFAEADAAPWRGEGVERMRVDDMAQALGAQRPGVDVWRVRSGAMALQGILPGDMILVDTHAAERVRAGDIVIAQRYDNAAGIAVTLLRRFEPPVLVAAGADTLDRRVHVVDNDNVVIRGKVVACWRRLP